jgi:hypothetical protein
LYLYTVMTIQCMGDLWVLTVLSMYCMLDIWGFQQYSDSVLAGMCVQALWTLLEQISNMFFCKYW